ncbi:MAG TPA: AmmeMemoRadiSam system radical SAM enzyme [Halanaerobiaceae bacterium]|jgi:pyruvate formate lyase activating enzyme|nr:AmmeMemoRadiSam system radical SAM enzyme [Bacillota bacterium]HHU92645.1 AmmeMemoRadiSam system radical SAM enzyme [Halanaerobiaceae bacterium]HOA41141.1 AmmeMemoRadiSam system radical SAM enzyme [Halanaerobiales bacterium]HPZ63356.1 AmmeMemoRadiSam system radical SAM enzyme [Halanaerobiales bacterium]HQD03543.1 AmmeMemoRadiSam system radical SAM enzyme [Halanaerobiales bacterium]
MLKEAEFYQRKADKKVLCELCPQQCLIPEGKRGLCQARVNRAGKLYTENYGKISSLALDPMEKKPLYHFYPGSKILSVGTFGCNFSCLYCQNWQISQEKPPLQEISPQDLVEIGKGHGSIGLAYTYSEPAVWFEFVKETAELARAEGLKNVIVSNGYLSKKALEGLLPYLDGANIDLKAFREDFYSKLCRGRLEPVLENIELLARNEIHLEVTTLLITDYNDSLEELEELFAWLAGINPGIPLHLSRYFPNYRLDKAATPIKRLLDAYHLAREYLDYVYIGNVDLANGSDTFCPQCGYPVVKRRYYHIVNHLREGQCPDCGYPIYGSYNLSTSRL